MKLVSRRRTRRVLVLLVLLLWFTAMVVFMDPGVSLAWWLFGLTAASFLLLSLLFNRVFGSYGWTVRRLDERQQQVLNRAGFYAYLLVGGGIGAIFGVRFGYTVGSESYTRLSALRFGVGELLLTLLAIFAANLTHAWLEPNPPADEPLNVSRKELGHAE